jgi:hypothetical protein
LNLPVAELPNRLIQIKALKDKRVILATSRRPMRSLVSARQDFVMSRCCATAWFDERRGDWASNLFPEASAEFLAQLLGLRFKRRSRHTELAQEFRRAERDVAIFPDSEAACRSARWLGRANKRLVEAHHVLSRRLAMKQNLIVLTTVAFIMASSTVAATQQSPASPSPQGSDQKQTSQCATDEDRSGMMMPGGMTGRGMMGESMMGHGMMRGGGMMAPFAMRIIFILMDTDGDGTISLQEFQAAHERLFKAMDANKDGVLTLDEMRAFMQGRSAPKQ